MKKCICNNYIAALLLKATPLLLCLKRLQRYFCANPLLQGPSTKLVEIKHHEPESGPKRKIRAAPPRKNQKNVIF